jgi:GT2 family glycosyltransferase
MSRRVKRRERGNPAAGLIHLLNQRYRREWERAEALQGELDRLKRSPLGPLIVALRWVKRQFSPVPVVPPLAERSTPYRPSCDVGSPTGLVSIIIPFRDQFDLLRNCLRSLRTSTYRHFEIILVNNGSTDPRTLRFIDRITRRPRLSVIDASGAFNFSRLCNAGAERASGDCLLFLNSDTEVLSGDWLQHLLHPAADPKVGVVGATLLYPDRTIQHAGLFPRADGEWVHPYRGEPENIAGLDGELRVPRCVPAVTGACLMLRREVFDELGGFDERFPTTFNDVELCCRARERGYSVVVTPHARLLHYEGLSRGYTP